ncbi:uncharacterized protein LOC119662126 isoform X2 [Teleopsis dalmanni]|uniref:uncharacterized protein LOC119662126 isoform X2 n=1 Tax=Teleopsis dalmanni TaxID=139649 RepID=UPI0018CCDEA6|nr:uncharacterized protein LOC119662126 isoform X2 [Teleopsis dalmanni]
MLGDYIKHKSNWKSPLNINERHQNYKGNVLSFFDKKNKCLQLHIVANISLPAYLEEMKNQKGFHYHHRNEETTDVFKFQQMSTAVNYPRRFSSRLLSSQYSEATECGTGDGYID